MTFSNIVKNKSSVTLQIFNGTSSPGMSGGPILRFNEYIDEWEIVSILLGGLIDNYTTVEDRISLNVGFSSGFCYGIAPYVLFQE